MIKTKNRKNIKLKGVPLPKQREFFCAKTKYIAYGGARGGGKSWALRRKLVLMCLKYSGLSALIIRRTFPELRENHIRPLILELKDIAVYTDSRKCFEFPNGSRLRMGYCDTEEDVHQYQGQEFDVIALDEATQLTEYQFQTLKGSLRGANNFPKRFYISCNPGGVGHAWVKRLFIDREYRLGEKEEEYTFIPARVYDNTILLKHNPDYLEQLKSLPTGLREAWLNGEWNAFAGQYFSEFDYDIHTVEASSPPAASKKYCAIDYGLDMLAVVFVAVDEKGNAVVYDEIHEPNLIVSEAAGRIREKSKDVIQFSAPGDLWNRQKDSGKSIAEIFGENGIWLTRIATERIEGWLCLKEWLKVDRTQDTAFTKLKIMRNCVNLIRCLPLLMHDKNHSGDVANIPHNITHIPDALRYFAVSRPSPARQLDRSIGIGKNEGFSDKRLYEKLKYKKKIF